MLSLLREPLVLICLQLACFGALGAPVAKDAINEQALAPIDSEPTVHTMNAGGQLWELYTQNQDCHHATNWYGHRSVSECQRTCTTHGYFYAIIPPDDNCKCANDCSSHGRLTQHNAGGFRIYYIQQVWHLFSQNQDCHPATNWYGHQQPHQCQHTCTSHGYNFAIVPPDHNCKCAHDCNSHQRINTQQHNWAIYVASPPSLPWREFSQDQRCSPATDWYGHRSHDECKATCATDGYGYAIVPPDNNCQCAYDCANGQTSREVGWRIYQNSETAIAPTVNCGGHRASSCDQCPCGSGDMPQESCSNWHGANWCNGDCAWTGVQCMTPCLPHCTYDFQNGDEFDGDMSTGVKEGDGTYTSANGDVFTGTYHSDNRTTGTYTAANGDVYVGDYLNEMKEDTSGVYTTTRGSRYEGGFHLDNWEGRGVFTWADGAVMTSGWCGGAPHGDGVIILGSKALLLQDGQRTSTTTVSDANQVASGIVAPSSCPARHAHWDETRDNPFSSGHGHSAASRPHRK
jgi:hypothetical protein